MYITLGVSKLLNHYGGVDNSLNNIEEKMRELGYDNQALHSIKENLHIIASLYKNPVGAAEMLERYFRERVTKLFDENYFRWFLRTVDPYRITDNDLSDDIRDGDWDMELDLLSEGEVIQHKRSKIQFKNNLIEERRCDLEWLWNSCISSSLQHKNYRKVQFRKGIPPIRITFIYTPCGGQPGNRRRRRK